MPASRFSHPLRTQAIETNTFSQTDAFPPTLAQSMPQSYQTLTHHTTNPRLPSYHPNLRASKKKPEEKYVATWRRGQTSATATTSALIDDDTNSSVRSTQSHFPKIANYLHQVGSLDAISNVQQQHRQSSNARFVDRRNPLQKSTVLPLQANLQVSEPTYSNRTWTEHKPRSRSIPPPTNEETVSQWIESITPRRRASPTRTLTRPGSGHCHNTDPIILPLLDRENDIQARLKILEDKFAALQNLRQAQHVPLEQVDRQPDATTRLFIPLAPVRQSSGQMGQTMETRDRVEVPAALKDDACCGDGGVDTVPGLEELETALAALCVELSRLRDHVGCCESSAIPITA